MKTWTMLLAMLALVLTVGLAQAAKGVKIKPVKGEIIKIEGANVTVQPEAKPGGAATDALVVATTDSTTITIDGEKKAVADLVVGEMVAVKLDTDGKTALTITVGKGKAAAKQ